VQELCPECHEQLKRRRGTGYNTAKP
jgi:hypothetical protein